MNFADDIKTEKLEWLWPNTFPKGKLCLIAGDPGTGKSLLALDIISRVTKAEFWPDDKSFPPRPGNVIILSTEDDMSDTIKPRLQACGADLCKVFLLEAVRLPSSNGQTTERSFSLELDIQTLKAKIEVIGNVQLIVIDPIDEYIGTIDSHKNADIRGLLGPFVKMIGREKITVIGIMHFNKGSGRAVDKISGSKAWVNVSRATWFLMKDTDNPDIRNFMPQKCNLAPEQKGFAFTIETHPDFGEPVIAWGGRTEKDIQSEMKAEEDQKSTQLSNAKKWLQAELQDGPVLATDIIDRGEKIGFAERTLQRARNKIKADSKKDGFQGKTYWGFYEEEIK